MVVLVYFIEAYALGLNSIAERFMAEIRRFYP